ncbi:MAG: hypothetical protein LLG04_15490 [Parachlamydia sp.]|nr:hypothetical protein [Parachlamydia sp.]
MMASAPASPFPGHPGPLPPVTALDVSHAPPSPPPETPVEITGRSWQLKGPLGSYALHADRMDGDFKKEQERLKGDLAKVFALMARYKWLEAMIDNLREERLPEIDAEWNAVRALKMELLASQNSSKKYSIESDARTLLPAWQSPLKIPESLKTYKRVIRVQLAQKHISEDASKRLVAFQKIEQDQKILETKLFEIEKLEKAIGVKFAALIPSTYALDEILSLKTECSIDKLRYPHAESSLKFIKDKFLGAEKVWKETRAITKTIREKLGEWAKVMVANADASPIRELEVQANFQRAHVQQQKLQCSRFSEPEFLDKVNYLARFGVVNPELNEWIAQAKEELVKRLKMAHVDLESLKQVLADFEKEFKEFHAQKGRLSLAPTPVPLLVETPPSSPGLLSRMKAIVSGKANKPAAGLYAAPDPVDWSKMVEIPARVYTSALLKSDRNESIRPPANRRRDLSQVPKESWNLTDRWDNFLMNLWPEAINFLNQSLSNLNVGIAKLELQFLHLQHAFRAGHLSYRSWLEALYWQLCDTAQTHSERRVGFQRDYDRIQTELKTVLYLLDEAIKMRPNASPSNGPLDVEVINLQRTMDDAVLDLKLLSAMLQIEWEFGQKAHIIQQKLQSLQSSYGPAGKKADAKASPEQFERQVGESIKRKKEQDRTTFEKVLKAETVSKRKALLAAMGAEGYLEEKVKLQGHDLNNKQQAEQIDRMLDQLLKIFANWQHFKNMAEAVAFAKPHLTEATIKLMIMQLMVAFNHEKMDVENYLTLIPELRKQMEAKVLWLEEKLSPDRVEWRELQERYLMRTQEGNRQRNQQIILEIAKYQLGMKAIEDFWSLGEQSCKEAVACINRLLTKNEGEGIEMISENPYLRKDQPAPRVLQPAAKPSAQHGNLVLLDNLDNAHNNDQVQSDEILVFSGVNVFGAPRAQPASLSPAPESEEEQPASLSPAPESGGDVLTTSGVERLMKQVDEIKVRAPETTQPMPDVRLTNSLYDTKGSGGPGVMQDE